MGTKKSNRILAAQTLAKLGESDAYDYLIDLLDDPPHVYHERGATGYDPGESIRAAQALADINGWDFSWNKSSVENVKRKVRSAS